LSDTQLQSRKPALDVICVGHACYDLVFNVPKHLEADEKGQADQLHCCGGGPAANAAIAIARLGLSVGFAGYLGIDVFGERHLQELVDDQVDTSQVMRGPEPTPLSVVMVKPDGRRSLVNYRTRRFYMDAGQVNLPTPAPKVMLFDGHEPHAASALIDAKPRETQTVLDAGSVHAGALKLMQRVDYLVASEKFACQYAETSDARTALDVLARQAGCSVVITLGARGLVWQHAGKRGACPAFSISAVDTTGAGDAFHGAFAAFLAQRRPWYDVLRSASAVAALCCRKMGARSGMPDQKMLQRFLERRRIKLDDQNGMDG